MRRIAALVVRLGLERAALAYVVLLVTGYLWLLFTALAYPGASGLLCASLDGTTCSN